MQSQKKNVNTKRVHKNGINITKMRSENVITKCDQKMRSQNAFRKCDQKMRSENAITKCDHKMLSQKCVHKIRSQIGYK